MYVRTRMRLVAPLVTALVAIPLGVVASQAAFADDTSEPSRSSHAQFGGPSAENPFPVTPDGWAVDTSAIHEAAVPLSECPELLAFLTSPEVNEFQTEHFGDPYTADTRFWPACPDLEYMRTMFEASRARILGGLK